MFYYMQGEFGIVYRGILNPNDFPQPVAAKTIKGTVGSNVHAMYFVS